MKIIKLEENEEIIKVIRKHWLPMVFSIIISFFVAIIPVFIFALLKNALFSDLTLHNLYIIIFFYIIYLIFVWISIFVSWINYYLDIWVLTNKKLIDIEQIGLFSRKVSSIRLDRIQDVEIEVLGIVDTFLKKGNIRVQTAANNEDFIIRSASNPEQIKQLIMKTYTEETEKAKFVKIEK